MNENDNRPRKVALEEAVNLERRASREHWRRQLIWRGELVERCGTRNSRKFQHIMSTSKEFFLTFGFV